MTHVKTAISLKRSVFEKADRIARKYKVSRSRLFESAFEDFIQRCRTQKLVDSLNECYADSPDENEVDFLRGMLALQSRTIREGQE